LKKLDEFGPESQTVALVQKPATPHFQQRGQTRSKLWRNPMAILNGGKAKDDLEIPAALKRNGKAPTVEELLAESARLKAAQQSSLKLKVSEKGGVSCYGLGRFPVTLYGGQWERLLDAAEEIREFLKANADSLSTK
jgi:hypothetical protein